MAPIGRREGLKMIESIKSIELLKGVRGERPSDLKAIVDNLQRLSQLVTDFPEIEEFDINPLMALEEGKGALTVDVRVALKVAMAVVVTSVMKRRNIPVIKFSNTGVEAIPN
jgi:4-hydroxybutyrate---CoA ligase (ADP-forming)